MEHVDPNVAEFYDQNCVFIGRWFLRPAEKEMLGDKANKRCRFCGRTEAETPFTDEAHAIPELLGNKSIATYWECDECNHYFGDTIENDLGNWSKPMRTFARIRGKRGVPTLKKGSNGGWRIEYEDESGFHITAYENEPVCEIDEAKQTVTFNLKRDPYTPVAVLKAFYKIAFSLMPEEEIKYFPHALAWVRHPDHQKVFAEQVPVLYTFQPGPMPNDLIVAFLLRRKNDDRDLPYGTFVLAYGNEMFQIFLLSAEKDGEWANKKFKFYSFPMPAKLVDPKYGKAGVGKLDFTGRDQVKGDIAKIVLGFDAVRRQF